MDGQFRALEFNPSATTEEVRLSGGVGRKWIWVWVPSVSLLMVVYMPQLLPFNVACMYSMSVGDKELIIWLLVSASALVGV